MTMQKWQSIFSVTWIWLLVLMCCTGCEHRVLTDIENYKQLFVRVYFDEQIRNVNYGFYDETKKHPEYKSPELLRVVLCDETTDRVVVERYLHTCGEDEHGYYIEGYLNAPEGRYNMMAYNFDINDTQIKYDQYYSLMTAYTKALDEDESNRFFRSRENSTDDIEIICTQPDHLFVAKIEDIDVKPSGYPFKPDTIKTHTGNMPVAKSLVKSYYMQVNVKGVEHVRSAIALITGMAGSKTLYNGEMVMDDEVSIYFHMNNGTEVKKRSIEEENTVAYATFNTFGKLPHTEGFIDITFEFNTVYNTVQTESFRVTDMFDSPLVKENQWIIIDKVVEINPPEGGSNGGMQPGVNEWTQVEGNITI